MTLSLMKTLYDRQVVLETDLAGVIRPVKGPVVTGAISRTLTGAEMAAGTVQQFTGTTASITFTLDTGTNLSTAVPGVAAGDSIEFMVCNSSTQTLTVVGDTGTTMANATTILTLQSRTFTALNTGANAWTIY